MTEEIKTANDLVIVPPEPTLEDKLKLTEWKLELVTKCLQDIINPTRSRSMRNVINECLLKIIKGMPK